ncbi:TonB-dependent receptor plug domain-containing protein [Sphingopyxis sp. H115]|uniref:TonB-dependent receptor plug domain-containing protein n=1 Tax=Sphingopyxis sp. H115 TaxID=1759073 RepID=UPI0007366BFE|nr:TonB-dependent receptor [Sphingopyxis sp. H115]KTE13767.1 hypothetical protein ATE71_09735 [Sphingopyxis sp. H115]
MKKGLFVAASIAALIAAMPAQAQEAEPVPSHEATADTGSEIVVTGSRIQRSGFDAPTPTTVVGEIELAQGNRPSIAQVLNDMPQFRPAGTPATTGGNTDNSASTANLRGLGSVRTLTLLNGHRFVGSNDLNNVPQSLIQRVDVVTGGASAAWGSGAVGGVVNIILDDEFEGWKMGAEGGISSRGDAARYRGDLAWGTKFAGGRGRFMIAGEYMKERGAFGRKDRPNLEAGIFQRPDGQLVLTRDPNYTIINNNGSILDTGGAPYNLIFNPDGSIGPFPLGSETSGQFTVGGNGQNIYDYVAVSSPYRRANIFARASYEISDAANIWIEGSYSSMKSSFGFFPETPIVLIRPDNGFLTPGAIGQLADAGVTNPFVLGRILDDVGPDKYLHYSSNRRQIEGAIGIEGSFGEGWKYNAYYDHGEIRNNQSLNNQRISARFDEAVDAVRVGNSVVCRINADADPTNDDPGCAPINLFGNGNISAEAVSYAFGGAQTIDTTKLDAVGAALSGQPFSTWAGPVDIAFGGEARWEEIANNYVDPMSMAGELSTLNFAPVNGGFNVKEVFGEINVPLLDIEGVARLEVNGAARYSDYSTSGGIWAWKTGGTLRLMDDLLLRAVYSRDIRSPSIAEYFTTRETNIASAQDPFVGAPQANVVSFTGGNPNLTPEISHTLTLGGSYSPHYIPGLRLSVDYYKIDIDNVITTLSLQDTINQCYQADPADPTCGGVIVRDGDGSIASVSRSFRNLASYSTKGLDLEASYAMPVGAGTLRFRALATHVFELFVGSDQVGIVGDQASFGTPKWRVTGGINYQDDDFGIDVRGRYVSGGIYSEQVGGNGLPLLNNEIDARLYVDLGLQFNTGPFTFFANVNNLFDSDPPLTQYTSFIYDTIGRYYSGGVKLKF